MYIAYSVKNGIKYARVCKSIWKDGTSRQTTIHNLGRVIDEEKGIYRNRRQGTFIYSLERDEFQKLPE